MRCIYFFDAIIPRIHRAMVIPCLTMNKVVNSGGIDAELFFECLLERVCSGMGACRDSVWRRFLGLKFHIGCSLRLFE